MPATHHVEVTLLSGVAMYAYMAFVIALVQEYLLLINTKNQ